MMSFGSFFLINKVIFAFSVAKTPCGVERCWMHLFAHNTFAKPFILEIEDFFLLSTSASFQLSSSCLFLVHCTFSWQITANCQPPNREQSNVLCHPCPCAHYRYVPKRPYVRMYKIHPRCCPSDASGQRIHRLPLNSS